MKQLRKNNGLSRKIGIKKKKKAASLKLSFILTYSLVILFLLFFSFTNAYALGIGPAKQEFVYDQHLEGKIIIENSDQSPHQLIFSLQGPLAEYIHLDASSIVLQPQERKTIYYYIEAPSNLGPGRVESQIIILDTSLQEGMVSARVALSQKIIVIYPYPEEYLESSIAVSSPSYKEPVIFSISLNNLGSKRVGAYAEVLVKGPTNNELFRSQTNKTLIPVANTKTLRVYWKPQNPGDYVVEVIVKYGGAFKKVIRKTQSFHVGGDELTIKSINVTKFTLGGVAKINVKVESNTNRELSNVYGIINITDTLGNVLARITTAPLDIEPFSTATLVGYWDTQTIKPGNYNFNVLVNYGLDRVSETFEAYVGVEEVTFTSLGKAIETKARSKNYLGILVILVLLLLAINLYWIFYLKKIFKKEKK